jgi:Predicted nucleotidyltransferases
MTQENPEQIINNPELRIANPHIAIPEETIRAFCKKWKIHSFSFYGSIMRDNFRPESDIDVMIEFFPDDRASSLNMGAMQEELEALLSRNIDLVERRSIEQSENYIRRKGILSGKPPVLRQMSYLLDMLISARNLQKIAGDNSAAMSDRDEMLFHAISYHCRWLAVSAHRVDAPTRGKYPDIPWDHLLKMYDSFEENFCRPDRELIREITWEVVPRIIPILSEIIPAEDEV